MSLTDQETEALRYHLGYGNVAVGAHPYTPDGFKELFDDVIAPYLTGTTETTASTSVSAGAATAVTPASMTDIVASAQLVVDVGDDAEVVAVKAVTATTFTAYFANAHSGTYPVALLGGKSRLRLLLWQADKAWRALQDQAVGATAGLKQVDKGDVEWFAPGAVVKERQRHYMSIVEQISRLVRVPVASAAGGACGLLEAY